MILHQLRPAAVALLLFTLITGIVYPLAVTGIAQVVWPYQANGSIIRAAGGTPLGAELIGQPFADPGYFWGRISTTPNYPYNAAASSGSNYGSLNPDLAALIAERAAALRAADPTNTAPIPVDLITPTGSGLDPHISPAAARYQAERVAESRGLSLEQVEALIAEYTAGRQLGILGEPRVNVLQLNLALDARAPSGATRP
ncbi:MAG: potassium-transporting ATPase subunit KdpC [Oscillochloris sp.]|nr:potassium-transporting ATPase subunit KdpC [Oscillochloris sp.]